MEYDPQNRRRRGRPGRKWIDGIRETMIDRAIEEDWMLYIYLNKFDLI